MRKIATIRVMEAPLHIGVSLHIIGMLESIQSAVRTFGIDIKKEVTNYSNVRQHGKKLVPNLDYLVTKFSIVKYWLKKLPTNKEENTKHHIWKRTIYLWI